MSELYCTPTLDEFHEGFEYEIESPLGGWDKSTFSFNNWDYDGLLNYIEKKIIRVPYLIKTDIEAEGFTQYGKELPNFYTASKENKSAIIHLEYRGIDHYLKIRWEYKKDNKVFIEIHSGIQEPREWEYLFNGTIRNKSEFKKLLQQLGINE